jgi:hypothetical protein
MPAPVTDTIILGGVNTFEAHAVEVPSHQAINEKIRLSSAENRDSKDGGLVHDNEIKPVPQYDGDDHEKDTGSGDPIIVTGADAAQHLLSIRDDGDSALTFRSLFLATILSAFQAVMTQIYYVSERSAIVALIIYVLTLYSVQTDLCHHSGYFHCPHRLLPWQSMGCCFSTW